MRRYDNSAGGRGASGRKEVARRRGEKDTCRCRRGRGPRGGRRDEEAGGGDDETCGEKNDGAGMRRRRVVDVVLVQVLVQRGADGGGVQQQQQRDAQRRDEAAEERSADVVEGGRHAAVVFAAYYAEAVKQAKCLGAFRARALDRRVTKMNKNAAKKKRRLFTDGEVRHGASSPLPLSSRPKGARMVCRRGPAPVAMGAYKDRTWRKFR